MVSECKNGDTIARVAVLGLLTDGLLIFRSAGARRLRENEIKIRALLQT